MKRVLYDDLRSMPDKDGFKNDRYCDYTTALPSSHSQVTPCQGQRRKRPLSPPLPAQVLFVLTSVEISCLGGVSLQSGRPSGSRGGFRSSFYRRTSPSLTQNRRED